MCAVEAVRRHLRWDGWGRGGRSRGCMVIAVGGKAGCCQGAGGGGGGSASARPRCGWSGGLALSGGNGVGFVG